jgi:hypothetical protein
MLSGLILVYKGLKHEASHIYKFRGYNISVLINVFTFTDNIVAGQI